MMGGSSHPSPSFGAPLHSMEALWVLEGIARPLLKPSSRDNNHSFDKLRPVISNVRLAQADPIGLTATGLTYSAPYLRPIYWRHPATSTKKPLCVQRLLWKKAVQLKIRLWLSIASTYLIDMVIEPGLDVRIMLIVQPSAFTRSAGLRGRLRHRNLHR